MFETCEKTHKIFPSEYQGMIYAKKDQDTFILHKYYWLFTVIYKQIIHYKSYDELGIMLTSFSTQS